MSTVPSLASCTTAGTRPLSSNLSDLSRSIGIHPYGNVLRMQVMLQLSDSQFMIVKQRCGQRGVGSPAGQGILKVALFSRSTRRDNRNPHGPAHALQQGNIVSIPRPAAAHAA